MKFKEIAHLYIGCQCVVSSNGDFSEAWKPEKLIIQTLMPNSGIRAIKPILRKRNSLSQQELSEIFDEAYPNEKDNGIGYKANCIRLEFGVADGRYELIPLLLKRGIDLFGLIENGEAIDATTIKSK